MKTLLTVLMVGTAFATSYAIASEATSLPVDATAKAHYQITGNWSDLTHGKNTLVLTVTDTRNQPVSGATITVDYDMVGMPMAPPNKPVVDKGNGVYEKRIFIGMNGTWEFDITVEANSMKDTMVIKQEITE